LARARRASQPSPALWSGHGRRPPDRVRLDGADLNQWAVGELGRHIGYLPQDVELFAGTVAENIARFEPSANPEVVIEAARAAGVHELIVDLRNGYETQIGEQGIALSGGQRQRIALARALYRNPFFVVLDEPNSNLDSEGEAALVEAISGIRQRGGIAVMITHRPNVLAGVDYILVMNQGRAQVFGPKDEVLKKLFPRLQTVDPAGKLRPSDLRARAIVDGKPST
jgi:ATP-binding cassette subfamily C protein PrsD